MTETVEILAAAPADPIPAEAEDACTDSAIPGDGGGNALGDTFERQLSAARALWEEEVQGERLGVQTEIAELRRQITELKRSAARRETELRCARYLRERSLDEGMVAFVLAPEETDVPDEILCTRAEALAGAVEAEAARRLREKNRTGSPAAGSAAPLTGAMIRETPIDRLAEML